MRLLHTAEWHLGRYFHGTSLLDDQAHVLDQLIALAIREEVDAAPVLPADLLRALAWLACIAQDSDNKALTKASRSKD